MNFAELWSRILAPVVAVVAAAALAWGARALVRLGEIVGRLDVALRGYNGNGGALSEIESLRASRHELNNNLAALRVTVENLDDTLRRMHREGV